MKVFTPDHKEARSDGFRAWLRSNGLDPSRIYRLELDGTTATVFEYLLRDGKFYVNDARDDVARRAPYQVQVSPWEASA